MLRSRFHAAAFAAIHVYYDDFHCCFAFRHSAITLPYAAMLLTRHDIYAFRYAFYASLPLLPCRALLIIFMRIRCCFQRIFYASLFFHVVYALPDDTLSPRAA